PLTRAPAGVVTVPRRRAPAFRVTLPSPTARRSIGPAAAALAAAEVAGGGLRSTLTSRWSVGSVAAGFPGQAHSRPAYGNPTRRSRQPVPRPPFLRRACGCRLRRVRSARRLTQRAGRDG